MIRICACDDEKRSLDRLESYLNKFFANNKEEFIFVRFSDGRELIEGYRHIYDVIFLDVMMEEMNGFETARRIRKTDESVIIIFLTQMMKYAINGYEVNAFDYIIKPIDYPSFELKFKRALRAVDKNSDYLVELNIGTQKKWVPIYDISYIEVYKHNLTYHTKDGDYTVRQSLAEVEKNLSDKGFLLISRYCLVNLRYVSGIDKDALYVGTNRIEISRRRRNEVLSTLMEFNMGGRTIL